MGRKSKTNHFHIMMFRSGQFFERLLCHGFRGTAPQKKAFWKRLGRRIKGSGPAIPDYPLVTPERHEEVIMEELSSVLKDGEVLPLISIIVLTYNGLSMNRDCIASILDNTVYPRYELLIVDNASTDGTREWLSTLCDPRVRVIQNDSNLGFATGNNVGIREAKGSYFALLNNDVVVTKGWLLRLFRHFRETDNLAICGPTTDTAGNEAGIPFPGYDKEKYPPLKAFSYASACMDRGEKVLYTPDSLLFFAVLINRERIGEKLGKQVLLDENYGTGMFEDDDFCKMVQRLGLSIELAEDSFVFHRERASFSKLTDMEYIRLFRKNRAYYENKWGEKWFPHRMRG